MFVSGWVFIYLWFFLFPFSFFFLPLFFFWCAINVNFHIYIHVHTLKYTTLPLRNICIYWALTSPGFPASALENELRSTKGFIPGSKNSLKMQSYRQQCTCDSWQRGEGVFGIAHNNSYKQASDYVQWDPWYLVTP